MNEEQRKSFEAVARPLIQWLNDNVNPHHTVVVTPTSAELLAGECTTYSFLDYVKDTANGRTESGVCLECKGAGGGASNELCEACDGTGQQPAQPLDVGLLPMGDSHPIELVKAGCDPITGKPTQLLAKHQPCGCIVCTCADDVRCHGCGAWHCGTHPVSEIPNAVYEQPAQPGSGEARRVSLEEEAAIEASLRFSDSEYQMAFREGYVRAMTIAGRRLTAAPLGDIFLTEADHASLFTFYNQCSDTGADGYTVAKEDMQRLAELGCVRHMGFGRYEVTRFGDWIIESTFLQNPTLPLKTIAEYNAEQARKVPRG